MFVKLCCHYLLACLDPKMKQEPTTATEYAQAQVRKVCATDVKFLALLMYHQEAICWGKKAVCILKIQVLVTVNTVEQ